MPLSADDRLVLIRVKVYRAKKHLSNLESEVIAFRDKQIYGSIADSDPTARKLREDDPRIAVIDFKDLAPNNPTSIGFSLRTFRVLSFAAVCMAGDVVQNLRSALDYLANQLVWVGSGDPPSRRVEFPIAKDADTYEREKARKVKGMCPKAVKAIDALKPYKGGNDALWRIHELNNIDKHRTLFTVDKDCVMLDEWLPPFGYLLKAGDPTFSGIFDDEVEKNMEFDIDEALGEPQISEGYALLPTLHQLVDFVDDLVLSFKPFLN
jgi:hypothetical protein